MRAESDWPVRNASRDRLEEFALRAIIEIRDLRRQNRPNTYFTAVGAGFIFGVFVATAGFLIGAAIR